MVKIQHFRSCHASVFIMSKRCIEQHTNDDESEPAIKKLHPDRSFTQLGLNKFFPGPATEVHLSPVRKYGIKVYSKSEICDASSDMEQKYRCFWNEKAEEICGSKATLSLLKTKQAIQGAIHSAWVIQKTEYLLLEVDHLRQMAQEAFGEKVCAKFKTVDSNAEKTSKSNAAISSLYNSLHPGSSYAERIQVGETVHKEMETLKRAQDALRKVMLRLRKEILKTAVKEDKGFSFGGCSEITDAELSSLSEDITGKTDDNDIGTCTGIPGMNEYDSD